MGSRIAWGLITLFALGIALISSRYLTLNPAVYFPQQRLVYETHTAGIILHIVGGLLALVLGPFQFLSGVRARWPGLHRWVGRLYLLGIALGGFGGLYMATYAYTGLVATLGFSALALLWLVTGAMALVTIRRGEVALHRRWMLRNFALTFAAVTLRVELTPLAGVLGEQIGYMTVAWACWIPNLLVAQWLIARSEAQPARPSVAEIAA
jgi:uncharacterized membrane protein